MPLTRREFLKTTAATASLAGLLYLRFDGRRFLEAAAASIGGGAAGSPVELRPTHCSLCSTVCDVLMHVRGAGGVERVVKIDGNPRSPINRGKTCARGQSGLRRLYNPNRLKRPLIRVEGSKRGEWRFRAASWDEAYKYIEEKLKEEGIKPYEILIFGGMIACAFYRPEVLAFAISSGIPNVFANTLQNCVLGEHFGISSVNGSFVVHDELIADYENASVILVVASNSSLAGISTSRAVRLGRAIEKGAKLIVLDPRRSETAAKAYLWLPVKPGTDLAFLLALINKLVSEEKYDKEFVTYHTNAPFLFYVDKNPPEPVGEIDEKTGFYKWFYVYDELSGEPKKVPGFSNTNEVSVNGERILPVLEPPKLELNGRPVKTAFQILKEKVSEYTLEWAARVMDVPLSMVREAAELFVNERPALVEPGWHDPRFEATVQARRAAALLQVLVGGYDRPGGWLFAGEMREALHRFWETVRKGELPKLPIEFPGFMAPYIMCKKIMCNPEFWPHKHPSVSRAWNDKQRSEGKPGVGFPLFSDAGLLDAVEGKLEYNGEPYRIRAVFVMAGNPIRAGMDAKMWERILSSENVKLVVVSDIVPSDTALYADVILPDMSYLEKHDPVYPVSPSAAIGFRRRNPVAPISSELRHFVDQLLDLSKILGSYDRYVAMLAAMRGLDPAELKRRIEKAYSTDMSPSKAMYDYQAEMIAKKLGMPPQEFSSKLAKDGVMVLKDEWEAVEELPVPFSLPVPTPSGRLEIFSNVMRELTQECGRYMPQCDPVIAYVPPGWRSGMKPEDKPNTAAGEFFFAYGKIPLMSYASTADIDLLGALIRKVGSKMHWLWMNPRSAAALGIRDGDLVEIVNNKNPEYKVRSRVYLTELVRPDTVFLPSNFGQESPAWRDIGSMGAPLNELIPQDLGVVVGVYKAEQTTVTVRKVGR